MSQMIDFTLPSCVPGRTLHAFRLSLIHISEPTRRS